MHARSVCSYRYGRWVDAIRALRLAAGEYLSRLRLVQSESQWVSPTPCDEWTVRDVADHILGGNRFTVLILGGLAPGVAMDRVVHGDFTGDPVREFEESAAAQLSALGRPGVLERKYEHPMGLVSGREIARLRMSDLVVHAWDLARALGLPESLDPDLVMESLAVFEIVGETFATAGFFGSGPSGLVGKDAPDQLRLLDMVGRRP